MGGMTVDKATFGVVKPASILALAVLDPEEI